MHNEILYDEQTVFPIEFLVLYGEELKENNCYEQAPLLFKFLRIL